MKKLIYLCLGVFVFSSFAISVVSILNYRGCLEIMGWITVVSFILSFIFVSLEGGKE